MEIISKSVNDTMKIGKLIAKNIRPGYIICLFGQLGTGKTVLAKGIADGLGIEIKKVISPSFVLIRQHTQGRLALYHFDLYRLKSPSDILGLGYEEYLFGEGITVIEWANRLGPLMPKEFLKIDLKLLKNSHRSLNFTASGKRYQELVKKIHEDIRH
jgi:tRNA threonylcarbamoyladenosine biosynthesis protein TsaE